MGGLCLWSTFGIALSGLFVIAVSKRGRDGSAGKGDAWGKELYDICDAVEYVKRHYALYVDPTNINITGASAGGMDMEMESPVSLMDVDEEIKMLEEYRDALNARLEKVNKRLEGLKR